MNKFTIVLCTIIFCFAGVAVAATLSVPCPTIIGIKATKTFAVAKNKYLCFKTAANAKKAGYRDEKTKRKWYPITTFSGQVGQTTDIFTTTASQWRMTWNHPGEDYFSITVYDAIKNAYQKLMVSTIGATTSASNYYGAGKFYLDVSADSDWTVTVEEYR
jgi:hypothetical protein